MVYRTAPCSITLTPNRRVGVRVRVSVRVRVMVRVRVKKK